MSPLEIEVNGYEEMSKPTVIGNVTLREWVARIKEGFKLKTRAEALSNPSKYKEIKESLFPVITYNFLYDGYKEDKNIIKSTGLLYFDIDDVSYDPSTLDRSKVLLLYKSFSGIKYSILVRVNNLQASDFKECYLHIAKDLGIDKYLDKGAVKHSQYNILSYDPDIFINEDCKVYDVDTFVLTSSHIPKGIEKSIYKELRTDYGDQLRTNPAHYGGKLRTDYGDQLRTKSYPKLRYDNLDNYVIDKGEWVFNFEEGFIYIKCFFPAFDKIKSKYATFMSYCTNLVYLNPWLSLNHTIRLLQYKNDCLPTPTSNSNITKIATHIHKLLSENRLEPILAKSRKIIFKKGTELSSKDKQDIARDLVCENKKKNSYNKLLSFITEWNVLLQGKITSRALCKESKMSNNTVNKYYPLFKDLIESKNNP